MSFATLTWPIAIMFAVAATAGLLGAYLLAQFRRPLTPARSYAYRMVAVMALALAAVLALSAGAMWSWNNEIAARGAA